MGTSTSFRAPRVPRWQAFTTALQQGLPLERVQSELFNAGREWEQELSTPAIAAFAVAVLEAHGTLAESLRGFERPEQAIQQALATARQSAADGDASAVTAVAERAFVAVLTRAAAGEGSLASSDGATAAENFSATRGSAQQLLGGYVGELLSQYARHVTAREAGALTEGDAGLTVRETRALTRRLAAAADDVGRATRPAAEDAASLRAAWGGVIADAFVRGRRLPEAGR